MSSEFENDTEFYRLLRLKSEFSVLGCLGTEVLSLLEGLKLEFMDAIREDL